MQNLHWCDYIMKKIIFCIITIVSLLLNVLHKFRLNKGLRCKLHFGKPKSDEQYFLLDIKTKRKKAHCIQQRRKTIAGRKDQSLNMKVVWSTFLWNFSETFFNLSDFSDFFATTCRPSQALSTEAPSTPTMSKQCSTLSKQPSTLLSKTATMSNEFIVKFHPFDKVECCFDTVAIFGNNLAGFGNNLVGFDNNVKRNFVLSTKSKQIEHVKCRPISTLAKWWNFIRYWCRN